EFVYVPGGIKGCKYQPYTRPEDNDKGGKDVPVIKLCADRYVISPGETVNLTASHSINASKFSGYEWLGGAVGDPNDIREATYTGTTEGLQQVCVKGNIGQSNNISTACVDIIVNSNFTPIDGNVETGFVDVFHYEVTDGDKTSKPGIVIITIGWENTPPQVTDLAITTQEDVATGSQLQGSDLDGHDITFSIVDGTSIGTATLDDATTGAFTYTPNPNANGVDTFTYVAHDGFENSKTGTVTITVESTNDAPVAHFAGILTTLEDIAVNGTLGATDPDEEDVMDFRLATLPGKGDVVITDAQTGAFTYTPHQDLNGSDSFFFVVHDGTLESNAAKVEISITPVNDAPVTEDVGPIVVDSDGSYHDVLTATDVDKNVLVYKVESQPAKGSVTLDTVTGEYAYIPNNGASGADSFTYSAADAFVSSNVSTVSFNIVNNPAPVCSAMDPIEVFQGVVYGGSVSCSDPQGEPLTYIIVDKGRYGSASFANTASAEYVYAPNPFASGSDFFTFKASDGVKESNPVTVQVELVNACAGPGNAKRDADGDGYADLIETEFGTSINDPNSTPLALITAGTTVSFLEDDDGDGFIDIAELWLLSDYKDGASMPSASTLKGVPNCLTAFYDSVPPALFAFNILTPTVDATPGDATARFALTAFDNATGVAEVNITLESPSGSIVKGKNNYSDKPVAAYVEFESDTFSPYAETGVWTVATLSVKDGIGNELYFTTQDLLNRDYPTALTITGLNDTTAPTLDSFQILTPTIDVCNGDDTSSVQVISSDDVSGIASVMVKLTSASGTKYNWGEIKRSDHPLNLTATINTIATNTFAEAGTWMVSELVITDAAGNALTMTYAELAGYGASVDVTCVPVDNPTELHAFTLHVPTIEAFDNSGVVSFDINASDDDGINKLYLELVSSSGGAFSIQKSFSDNPTSISTETLSHPLESLNTGVYDYCSTAPTLEVKSLTITDGNGNQTSWSKLNIDNIAGATTVVQLPASNVSTESGTCGWPAPICYAQSIHTVEDDVYSGTLQCIDIYGDPLTIAIVDQGSLGSVSITNAATGEFTYTPQANINSQLKGEDFFTFKANDGGFDSNIA
ncbi:MAG: Ig-like domain-containing protein, partial [Thioalkalispiraceae bacterium]